MSVFGRCRKCGTTDGGDYGWAEPGLCVACADDDHPTREDGDE